MMKTKNFISTCLMIFLFILTGCEKEEINSEEFSQANLEKKALRHTKQYDASVATNWFTLLTDLSKNTPYFNPQSIRILTYSSIALYESVIPGMPSYNSIYEYYNEESIQFNKKKDYYWPAAANAAIYNIALKMIADYPQRPNLEPLHQLYANLNESYLSVISEAQLETSTEFGKYVADLVYEWAKTDGTFNADGSLAVCPPYIPLGGPGDWEPTPPMYFPAAGACQGDLRTFIPNIGEMVLPPDHPEYSTDPSSEFYALNQEVYQLTLNPTPEDILNNQQWRDIFVTNYNVPTHLFRITSELIKQENVNLADASELLAKQGMAMSDVIGATFYAKFHYALIRPVTYIQEVLRYSDWNGTYPAPQHPSYPALTGVAAASAVIWEDYFGSNFHFVDSIQADLYGSFTYNSFDELVLKLGRGRTHSGINYQFSIDAGIAQGEEIGEIINSLTFKK